MASTRRANAQGPCFVPPWVSRRDGCVLAGHPLGVEAGGGVARGHRGADLPCAVADRLHVVRRRRRLDPSHQGAQLEPGRRWVRIEGSERLGEGCGVGKAVRGVTREGSLEDLEEAARELTPRLAQRLDAAVADGEQHRELAAPREERLAEEHLGEHHGEGEEVGAVIEGLPGDLLRGEVGELALQHRAAGRAHGGAARRAGDAEVAELHAAVDGQVEVRRCDVAMDDAERLPGRVARAVDALQRAEDLAADVYGHAGPELAAVADEAAQQAVEVAPVDELHRQPWFVGVHARAVDLDHVLVVHGRMQRRLPLEHRAALGIRHEVRQEALDDEAQWLTGRAGSLRVDRPRDVDLCRSTHGEPRVEPVGPELDRPAR